MYDKKGHNQHGYHRDTGLNRRDEAWDPNYAHEDGGDDGRHIREYDDEGNGEDDELPVNPYDAEGHDAKGFSRDGMNREGYSKRLVRFLRLASADLGRSRRIPRSI